MLLRVRVVDLVFGIGGVWIGGLVLMFWVAVFLGACCWLECYA